jgi:ABC-type phosphate/phosphonate transport system ATPase subunit
VLKTNANQKKVIVVVGNMGEGKSSFIKMLVEEEDKTNIKIGHEVDSCTIICSFYKMAS